MTTAVSRTPTGKTYVHSLPVYVPGRTIASVAQDHGLREKDIVKLASNENPLGSSPRAQQAILKLATKSSAYYPDSDANDLKRRLQQKFGVCAEWVTVGSGSSELIDLAARIFAGPGDSILFSQHAFASYTIATAAVQARAIIVPSKNFAHDLPAMLQAIDDTTRLIYVANPNNPTGTFASPAEMEDFLCHVPSHVALFLDEAYAEYLSDGVQSVPADLVDRYPNLIIARTFSKIYGLAGMRVGYCITRSSITRLFNKVRLAFNTTHFAQAAAAAALDDAEFVMQSRAMNESGKQQLYQGFRDLGLPFVESHANFVLARAGNGQALTQSLLERGMIVRPVGNYQLPDWIRVSIGTQEQNATFLVVLSELLAGKSSMNIPNCRMRTRMSGGVAGATG